MVLAAMEHLYGSWPDRHYIQTTWQSRTHAKCAMLTARGRGEYAQVRDSVWRELLATVHWMAAHDGAHTVDKVIGAVHESNDRKAAFEPRQIPDARQVRRCPRRSTETTTYFPITLQ